MRFIALLVALIHNQAYGVPTGFVEEGVTTLVAITGAFAPNPRNGYKPMLLLSSKEGKISVLEDPDNSEDFSVIMDLEDRMCHNGERGLQSIRPHPNFTINHYIYVFYAQENNGCDEDYVTGPRNRLSRFTMDTTSLEINVDTELILFETPPLFKRVHNGGNIAFGNDGKLYVTTGDAGSRNPANSQDPGHLHGKILRLNDDGTIPTDNPYASTGVRCNEDGKTTTGVCAEIWAIGMRNPFRLAMDPNTVDKVKFHIGDVGASKWEEISEGGTDYPLANYGWPVLEGPCTIGTDTECGVQSKYQDPFYYYQHTKDIEGGAVTGSVFVPDGLWPSDYQFMFIDFIFGEIFNLIEDASVECRECIPPYPGYRNETFHEHPDMVDVFFGPFKDTRALYIVSRSTGGQNIRRIYYTGTANRSPVANFTLDFTFASVGQVLTFDGSTSSDPDGDAISFTWDFGDGGTSALESPEYSFESKGSYKVTLTVTDAVGLSGQYFLFVAVGTPPTAKMVSPAVDSTFSVRENLLLSGSAKDSDGVALNSSQIFWEVQQRHASHFHPFLDKTAGNDFPLFDAPEPEDYMAATNSFLRVIMTAVDSNGVWTEIVRDVYPNLVSVDIDSVPQKLNVLVDEFRVETPGTITSWENHFLRLNVEDEYPLHFKAWSDGSGNRSRTMTIPAASSTNPYISAIFDLNETATDDLELVWELKNCSDTEGCGRCEGHCESNEECIGGLICFQKGGRNRAVPGCLGFDTSNTDWCTLDPFFNFSFSGILSDQPTSSPTTATTTSSPVAPTSPISPVVTPEVDIPVVPVGIPQPSDSTPLDTGTPLSVAPLSTPDPTEESIILVGGDNDSVSTSDGDEEDDANPSAGSRCSWSMVVVVYSLSMMMFAPMVGL